MLISSNVDVLTGLLEEFRPCFSKPQFRNFSTYTLGLIACEGKKNIDAINRCFRALGMRKSISYSFFLISSFIIQSPKCLCLSLFRYDFSCIRLSSARHLVIRNI